MRRLVFQIGSRPVSDLAVSEGHGPLGCGLPLHTSSRDRPLCANVMKVSSLQLECSRQFYSARKSARE